MTAGATARAEIWASVLRLSALAPLPTHRPLLAESLEARIVSLALSMQGIGSLEIEAVSDRWKTYSLWGLS